MHILKTPGAYFNEFDPGAAAWLRELIKRGLIADGDVDERSILDVRPADVLGYTQCHFFAGIGGWSYALRLAGWPDDRPVWTGSPPCQPFSVAGEGKGRDDARHLAPKFISLVRFARPAMLFGEQVASSEVFGKAPKRARGKPVGPPQWAWLDDLHDRLEAARYAVGASDFPSAGVGAPHIRQRTFFGAFDLERMAYSDSWQCNRIADGEGGERDRTKTGRQQGDSELAAGGEFCRLVNGIGARLEGHGGHGDGIREPGRIEADATGSVAATGTTGRMADFGAAGPWKSYSDWFGVCWHPECSNSDRGWCDCNTRGAPDGWVWDDDDGWLADADGRDTCPERQQRGREQRQQPQDGGTGRMADSVSVERECVQNLGPSGVCREDVQPTQCRDGLSDLGTAPLYASTSREIDCPWGNPDWLFCRDGKWRPVEPAVLGMADGLSAELVHSGAFVPASQPLTKGGKDARRVMRLRGYGNAINPHAAAQFIKAFEEAMMEAAA